MAQIEQLDIMAEPSHWLDGKVEVKLDFREPVTGLLKVVVHFDKIKQQLASELFATVGPADTQEEP